VFLIKDLIEQSTEINKSSYSIDQINLDNKRKLSAKNISPSKDCIEQQRQFNGKLNYEIEIEHPYLISCLLRGEYTEEALNFYEQLKLIENN
jgi:hypothetical protein